MTSLAVTDTHALIWYSKGQWAKLGDKARAIYKAADAQQALIFVPTIVLIEIGDAVWRGKIILPEGFSIWMETLLSHKGFAAVELSTEIVREAQSLYNIPERSDRLIAATAKHLDYPLITKDREIQDIAGVTVIW